MKNPENMRFVGYIYFYEALSRKIGRKEILTPVSVEKEHIVFLLEL